MTKPTHTIDMNGTKHILTLGLGFLDKLDEVPRYQMERDGVRIGASLNLLYIHLSMRKASAIRDVIRFGTMTNVHRPTVSEIETWIYEQLDDEEKADKMFEDFLAVYEKLPGAKAMFRQVEKASEKQAEE